MWLIARAANSWKQHSLCSDRWVKSCKMKENHCFAPLYADLVVNCLAVNNLNNTRVEHLAITTKRTQAVKYSNLLLRVFFPPTKGFSSFYLLFVLWICDLASVYILWAITPLCLVSFSRLSEYVSLHLPSFRSYWEMAAPLKFNPLSCHSPDRQEQKRNNAEVATQTYKDIQECI